MLIGVHCIPYIVCRDKSILLLFLPFFLALHFYLTCYAQDLFKDKLCIASYSLTVTSYTLYTSTTYTHNG